MKALGLVFSDKKIFENCNLKTYFWHHDLLMQPIRTIWTIFVGDHTGAIPVGFDQIPISGSRKEVVWRFLYIIQCKIVTPRWVSFNPRGIIWTTLVEDLYIMLLYTNYKSSGPCIVSGKRIFEKLDFKNLFFFTHDLLMQPIRTIWTILADDYTGTFPVEFSQNPISGSR